MLRLLIAITLILTAIFYFIPPECKTDADCVPAQCCHATKCVPKSAAPDCEGVFCSQECRPGSIDCGGRCICVKGRCKAFKAFGLPNPASRFCIEHGYKLEIRDSPQGQYGVCIFPDGSECEEWAYYRGECGPQM